MTHQDVVVTVSVEVRLGTPVPLENNLPSTICLPVTSKKALQFILKIVVFFISLYSQ